MCLSTVYKNTMTPDAVVLSNVMKIECKDGVIVLTDLMERQVAIEGTAVRSATIPQEIATACGLAMTRLSNDPLHHQRRKEGDKLFQRNLRHKFKPAV